ncbi:MAG TPA: hypothetical protein VIK50_01605 [Gemmatimonadaceae bacterium]
MRSSQPRSLERVRFGRLRTLNVRASMLTGAQSAARVDAWLRSKQVELSGEVLVITGRGAGSLGGVPVVKEATRRVLNRLRRLRVIESFGEDTPGSFIVVLAPLRSLLEAPARRRTPAPTLTRQSSGIQGLRRETREQLRYLATRAIDALGVKDASDGLVAEEMVRQFTMIARTAPQGVDADRWMNGAIARALLEYSESDR